LHEIAKNVLQINVDMGGIHANVGCHIMKTTIEIADNLFE